MNFETRSFEVGALRCTMLSDGTVDYPPEPFFAGIPAEERAKAIHSFGGMPGTIPSPWTCLFVDTGRHKILIDCGGGPGAVESFPGTGQLRAGLESQGIALSDINLVILTHGHPDHIGGTVDAAGAPAFANARYVMFQAEWQFWSSEANLHALEASGDHLQELLASFARQCLPPIKPQLELLRTPGEVVPGIEAVAAPGHTPGHMVVRIQSDKEVLLYLADTAVHPLFLENPSWKFAIDQDQDEALASRRRICDMAAAEGALVLGFHFTFPGLGHIVMNGTAWRWERLERVPL